ncbi:TonB-dependent receptor [Wenyingzhuangia aestuarii]|uniref:TonB-dependent receptor n=1 Tax=Wenyingzhuangia aestuarii TaxID=1647582 RepID=UPI00143A7FF4|nr:TonB-dependent receptor [Wenyingzhuangia aestuarii]NJB82743.1 outer membrane receptor protein involved in Fe transport [Wenyingzhuangia aestuarii]
MNKTIINRTPLLLLFLIVNSAFSQSIIKGKVMDKNNQPIASAIVEVKGLNTSVLTSDDGAYLLENVEHQTYSVSVSSLGYQSQTKQIKILKNLNVLNFRLMETYENLNTVVVTGTFDSRKQIESSTSVSVLNNNQLSKLLPRGTADLLRNVPGTFTDASAGEVFTKVYSRGVSASAEDDLGWYYTSLQEDGLPVSLMQHSYFSPDLFYRNDISTERVEAIRGGSAAITAMNAPGGIYNFISLNKTESFGGQAQVTSGVQGDHNAYNKVELALNGDLGNNWFYNIGGHFRQDDGARNVDFTFSKGGQVKMNVINKNDRGYFKFYAKYLNDKTNRWNGVTAKNWDNPTAVYGQDFNTTSQLLPSFNASIPDGSNATGTNYNSFNPSQGVLAKDIVGGFDFSQNIGDDWTVKNNIKLSHKSANWQTAISNAFVSINNPLAYFITGAGFPVGKVVFKDAKTGNQLAQVDNSAILAGGNSTYISGSLPNDAILGTAGWYKDTKATEVMDKFVVNKKWENHNFNTGLDFGYANTNHYTQSSFVFATYENNPRNMVVTLENPGSPVVALSDENGMSNYGGLFFEKANATLLQTAWFVNDLWEINEQFQLDAGLRFENIYHKGDKFRSEPFSQTGGFDGNTQTDYDNGLSRPNGTVDAFDFNYNYLSYSVGLNYKIKSNLVLFGRYSKGNKAPEFDYYFNNFTNVPIPKKGEVQNIHQYELGVKYSKENFYISATNFISVLSNIGTTNFEFDDATNTIFYTPTQYNNSRTLGMEVESMYQPFDFLRFNLNGVLQKARSKDWTVYDAAGTVDDSDDSIVSFNNQKLPFNPNLMFNFKTTYLRERFYAFFDTQYMGKRYGNIANGFVLPSYVTFDAGAGYSFTKNLELSVNVTNLFNSEGLANFFGPNSFGGNANQATPDYVANNPDQNFIVVPILPRGIFAKVNYKF